jgi:hypothetical protein
MLNARGQKRERSPTGDETGPPSTRRSRTRDLDHVGPPNLLDTITGKPWSIAKLKSAHERIRKDNDLNKEGQGLESIILEMPLCSRPFSNDRGRLETILPIRQLGHCRTGIPIIMNTSSQTDIMPTKEKGKHLRSGS